MEQEIPESLLIVRERAINRPKYRGVLHSYCFFLSIPIGLILIITAPTARTSFAAFTFAFGISSMLGISALFHRTEFTDRGWMRFRRLDHIGIYLCIAGGSTPIGMLAVDGWVQKTLLITAWVGLGIGATLRFLPFDPPYGLMNALFLSMGWVSVVAIPQLWDFLELRWIILLAIGGMLYTLGAFIVGLRKPDPWPDIFGYHEIWHLMVVAAASLHYCVMAFGVIPNA
ncbi:MAG: hemolysin III family protein [Actinomycetota bacterium]|nr:hemolysin III family protein [Actinomycetota bacterium]